MLIGFTISIAKKPKTEEKPDWAKKDIRDFSDADMERYLMLPKLSSYCVPILRYIFM